MDGKIRAFVFNTNDPSFNFVTDSGHCQAIQLNALLWFIQLDDYEVFPPPDVKELHTFPMA